MARLWMGGMAGLDSPLFGGVGRGPRNYRSDFVSTHEALKDSFFYYCDSCRTLESENPRRRFELRERYLVLSLLCTCYILFFFCATTIQ